MCTPNSCKLQRLSLVVVFRFFFFFKSTFRLLHSLAWFTTIDITFRLHVCFFDPENRKLKSSFKPAWIKRREKKVDNKRLECELKQKVGQMTGLWARECELVRVRSPDPL